MPKKNPPRNPEKGFRPDSGKDVDEKYKYIQSGDKVDVEPGVSDDPSKRIASERELKDIENKEGVLMYEDLIKALRAAGASDAEVEHAGKLWDDDNSWEEILEALGYDEDEDVTSVDVVDTTDGVDSDEEESLRTALKAMTPEKRKALLAEFFGPNDDIPEGMDPIEAAVQQNSFEKEYPQSGNTLAKLIGSLKY